MDITDTFLDEICKDLNNYSGADIASIAREAGLLCVAREG